MSRADGIFVSNHGGRQLDGAVSTMEALPEIVAELGPQHLHFDQSWAPCGAG